MVHGGCRGVIPLSTNISKYSPGIFSLLLLQYIQIIIFEANEKKHENEFLGHILVQIGSRGVTPPIRGVTPPIKYFQTRSWYYIELFSLKILIGKTFF